MIFTFDHDYYLINVRCAICFFNTYLCADVHVCFTAYDFIMNLPLQAIQCDTGFRHVHVGVGSMCFLSMEHMGLITAYWSKTWLGYVMNVDAEY